MKETLGAHLRNLLTPYKNLLQLVKDGKVDEETIRKYNLDNLDELIAFSNSEAMEQNRNQEPASENLEQAANQIVNKAIQTLAQKYKDGTYVGCIRDCFDRKEFIDLVKAGAKWQREQMMKDAIEGKVTGIGPLINGQVFDTQKQTRRLSSTYSFGNSPYCELGDKVKVIILPSDNK